MGEIKNLCNISNPTHGLITNIAPAHLIGFGSIEKISKEKGYLFNSLKNGLSFVNLDDKRITSLKIIGKGRTVITIAHRLSTIAHANQIIVIESGKVVEYGSHSKLLRLKNRYFEMWQQQLSEQVGE